MSAQNADLMGRYPNEFEIYAALVPRGYAPAEIRDFIAALHILCAMGGYRIVKDDASPDYVGGGAR